MINVDRLAETFRFLAEIDSISKEEGKVAAGIAKILRSMGAEFAVDHAGERVGGDTGNLIAKFKGNTKAEPLLLCGHMDTVEPGRGVKAGLKNGVFTSDGTTILGADDKAAIAIIIEVLRSIQENDLLHGPLEIVFTICEEVGLLGAKNLEFEQLSAKFGYVLDAVDIEGIVTKAPAANHLRFEIHGKDAHAGIEPEKGINAIAIAAKALAGLRMGRIDSETTCNIGKIEGGKASNIVPNLVKVEGEVRSHNEKKLAEITDGIVESFKKAVESYKERPEAELPALTVHVYEDFPAKSIPDDHPVVQIARKAAADLGLGMQTQTSGGGSDASIFCKNGIITGVLGTGMTDVHTVRESVRVEDMVRVAELLLEIIRIHSGEGGTH